MFGSIGRQFRRIDGWFFSLSDKQRVGVVLGTALFLFSTSLYCLGIASVVLLQRPYEAVAESAPSTNPGEPTQGTLASSLSTPTALPTPTQPTSGSPVPTPIAGVEIAEPPAAPRVIVSEPVTRPRVVAPEVREPIVVPQAPRIVPTAVPTAVPVIRQPTAAAPVATAVRPIATAPGSSGAPTQAARPTSVVPTVSTATTAVAPRQPTAVPATAVPKPAQPTATGLNR